MMHMKNTITVVLVTSLFVGRAGVEANQAPVAPDVAPAAIVTVPSAALGRDQLVTILLPSSYTQPGTRYPVLYLLHGGGQDHTAFATRIWFGALRARNMIIVTPGVGESWYVNSVSDPTARYEDFIVKELVTYVDSHYRTMASRDGRAGKCGTSRSATSSRSWSNDGRAARPAVNRSILEE